MQASTPSCSAYSLEACRRTTGFLIVRIKKKKSDMKEQLKVNSAGLPAQQFEGFLSG
jgi:hypothetical protein